jgi:regulatory protein
MRILARREHSTAELRQKLRRRGFEEEAIGTVVAECRRLAYLDDERAGRQMIDSLVRRGFGVLRIRSEFVKRGLSGEACERMLDDLADHAVQRRAAEKVLIKKDRTALCREADERKRMIRLHRFLRSRGFPEAVIYDVLNGL